MNAQMSSTATTEENGTAASERYMKATKLSTIVITKHTPGNRDAVRIIVRIHVSPWLPSTGAGHIAANDRMSA